MLLAVLILIVNRPVSFGIIIGLGLALLGLVLIVELVRRPPGDSDDEKPEADSVLIGASAEAAQPRSEPEGITDATS